MKYELRRSMAFVAAWLLVAGFLVSVPGGRASAQSVSPSDLDEVLRPPVTAGMRAPVAAAAIGLTYSQQVSFFPQDTDASATVINLFNTTSLPQIIELRGFANNVLVYSSNVQIQPNHLMHVVSDPLVAAPPPSWESARVVEANFTDFTHFVVMTVPLGVQYDGYVVFNPGTGVVDPRLDQGAIPLRFTAMPAVPTRP